MAFTWLVQLVVLLLAQSAASASIVGRWDGDNRSRGGLGAWMTFGADGSCTQTNGAMVDGQWTLTGNRLTRVIPLPDGQSETRVVEATVRGDFLTQQVDQKTHESRRFGSIGNASQPIVGVWSAPHDAGGTAYEVYLPDGRWRFRLPITSSSCKWTMDGDGLQLTTGTRTRRVPFAIAGDRLTLDLNGVKQPFQREEPVLPPAQKR